MGMAMGGGGDGFENAVEEEIGTRRECMRALLGLARCGVLARHDVSFSSSGGCYGCIMRES